MADDGRNANWSKWRKKWRADQAEADKRMQLEAIRRGASSLGEPQSYSMANDGRNANWSKWRKGWRADQADKRRQLGAIRREAPSLGAPKGYFAAHREAGRYDPLKDPNIGAEVREARRENAAREAARREKRQQDVLKSARNSGLIQDTTTREGRMEFLKRQKEYWNRQKSRPGDPVLGNGEHAGKQFDNPRYGDLYNRARDLNRDQFRDYWRGRLDSASKRLADANASIEDAKKRGLWGDGPIVGGVGGVMDAMWAREKQRQEEARQKNRKALGTDGEKPVAMGGVHFTGPNNTPYRAGSGNKRLVQEYAMAKAREASEHAMYVANRSAALKAEKEERAKKGDFIHRNYAEFTKQLMLQQLANDKTWKEVAVLKAIRDAGRAGYRPEKAVLQKTGGVPIPQNDTPVKPPEVEGFSGGNRDPNFRPGESWSSPGGPSSSTQAPASKEAPVNYAQGNYDAADIDSQIPDETQPPNTQELIDAMTPVKKYIW